MLRTTLMCGCQTANEEIIVSRQTIMLGVLKYVVVYFNYSCLLLDTGMQVHSPI